MLLDVLLRYSYIITAGSTSYLPYTKDIFETLLVCWRHNLHLPPHVRTAAQKNRSTISTDDIYHSARNRSQLLHTFHFTHPQSHSLPTIQSINQASYPRNLSKEPCYHSPAPPAHSPVPSLHSAIESSSARR